MRSLVLFCAFTLTLIPSVAQAQQLAAPNLLAPKDCQNIGMNTGPGVQAFKSFAECTQTAPMPSLEGDCQCVVSIRTSRRETTQPNGSNAGDLLFQECRGHFGHRDCPSDPNSNNCGDGRHSAPYGNWGVRVMNTRIDPGTPLTNPDPKRLSGLQDCQQWPGTVNKPCGFEGCRQWHTCTCDRDLSAAHFGGEPPPGFVSDGDALAGFFVVDSDSLNCAAAFSLPGGQFKKFKFTADLELFELDADASDFITRIPVTGEVAMGCGRVSGCDGRQDRVRLTSARVQADAEIVVNCGSRELIVTGDDDDDDGGPPRSAGLCERCGAEALCSGDLQCFADNRCHTLDVAQGEIDECLGTFLVAGTPSNDPLQIFASPTNLSFSFTTGGALPAAKDLSISSNRSAAVPAFLSSNRPWLRVSPVGTGTASVRALPAGLAPGTYSGAILVSADDAVNSPLSVPVSFTISGSTAGPRLNVSATFISFTVTAGAPNPAGQGFTVGSTLGPLAFSASSSAPWLSVSPAAGTASPGSAVSLTAMVNAAGLAPGTYNAALAIAAAGAENSPVSVPVRLVVNAVGATVAASPTSLTFTAAQAGPNPPAQGLSVSGATGSMFSAASNAPWLSVTPPSAFIPGEVSAAVEVSGLTPGTYSGAITLSSLGLAPRQVPVTLNITAATLALKASPQVLVFNGVAGSPTPLAQMLAISTTGAAVAWTASADVPWLSLAPVGGSTPANSVVSVATAGLAPGIHRGKLTISANGLSAVRVPVEVALSTASPTLAVMPAALSFSTLRGSFPPTQSFRIESPLAGGVAWSAASTVPWLQLGAGGTTPSTNFANLTDEGVALAPGAYEGVIFVLAIDGSTAVAVPVSLTITTTPPPTRR